VRGTITKNRFPNGKYLYHITLEMAILLKKIENIGQKRKDFLPVFNSA
jgi:hypothetical protein